MEQHYEQPNPQPALEQGEDERRVPPRIYVASLSDYNAGRLHGSWLDADQDPEVLMAGISEMLARSREPMAEEWAIHDYEGFGNIEVSEFESVQETTRLAKGIVEHGPAFAAWAQYIGPSSRDELDRFEECYQGEWSSLSDYAESLVEDLGLIDQIDAVVPQGFQPYVRIDFDALGRDMNLSGDVVAVENDEGNGVFVFSPL